MPFGFDFGEEKVLETISIGYLYPGMVAQDDIYNYNGKLLLVAKGITLTDTLISRLKNFNDSQHNIKVSSEVRRELVNRGIPKESKQKKFENTTGYSALKTETENMLTVSQVTDSVPYQQASDAGKSVIKRIDVTDPAELFQCINAGNEVDEYLYRHSTNVAIINGLMAKWLGFGKRQTQELVLLGLVHDVGKTRIPSQILDFPGKLGEDDYELVKKHPVYSQEMISNNINFNEDIKKGVRHHHERMNGEGYPDGLRADDIPLYSRI
ncbi:MAG: HD domain-containing protein, partial [Oscillospiraceae bacterium]|nr:HD domain-containing protein [Oscillospiraceae bacterium]